MTLRHLAVDDNRTSVESDTFLAKHDIVTVSASVPDIEMCVTHFSCESSHLDIHHNDSWS